MSTVTASDLLHIPHIVICRRDGAQRIEEFSDGHKAHEFAERLIGSDWGEIIVCARIRTLGPAKFANRQATN